EWLDIATSGNPINLMVVEEQKTEELFGISLNLGTVRHTLHNMSLVGAEQLHQRIEAALNGDTEVEMCFETNEQTEIVSEFINWIDKDNR
ncbi:MAG: hypothetical protein M3Q45_04265, partial [Chloroflexota bacterium]|nr:hypothetical protein [Chloroflexota bacterium]